MQTRYNVANTNCLTFQELLFLSSQIIILKLTVQNKYLYHLKTQQLLVEH